MKFSWALACAVVALVGVGCDSAAPIGRTAQKVDVCLRARHLVPVSVRRGETLLDTLSPRPRSLVSAVPGLIAIYADPAAAAHIFSLVRTSFPVLQESNAIVLFMITPQPTAGQLKLLERCAFGRDSHPAIGPFVLHRGIPKPRSGKAVMFESGCLACHRIGTEGTSGIGPNLTDVGARLTRRAITRALRHPTPPMPSFTDLSQRDLRALVEYLSRLHGS
jgi:hypothetical protein